MLVVILGLGLVLGGCTGADDVPLHPSEPGRGSVESTDGPDTTFVPRQGVTFLVNSRRGAASSARIRDAITAAQGHWVTAWPEIGVSVGVAPRGSAAAVVRRLRAMKAVESAGLSGQIMPEKDRLRVGTPAPSLRPERAGAIADAAKAPEANRYASGQGVSVGVADSGLFDEHEEFAGRFDAGKSGSCAEGGVFHSGGSAWRPTGAAASAPSHGTHVASVIAAGLNGKGLRGVAPNARIVAIRVGNDEGNFFPEAAICAAMTAVDQGLPIVNYSFGVDYVGHLRAGFWNPDDPDQAADITAIRKAFAYSAAHGVLNVVATGNSGEDDSDKPAIPLPGSEAGEPPYSNRLLDLLGQMPGTVGVGESYLDGTVASSSTSGFGITDMVAVGTGLLASNPNTYAHDAGTSFAAPAVSGTAALIKQVLPDATPQQLAHILYMSATPRTCENAGTLFSEQPCRTRGRLTNFFGHGQLNALKAVRVAMSGDRHGIP